METTKGCTHEATPTALYPVSLPSPQHTLNANVGLYEKQPPNSGFQLARCCYLTSNIYGNGGHCRKSPPYKPPNGGHRGAHSPAHQAIGAAPGSGAVYPSCTPAT